MNEAHIDDTECKISRSALLRVLRGVGTATNRTDEELKTIVQWIESYGETRLGQERDKGSDHARTLSQWHNAIETDLAGHEDSRQLASLTVAISLLRENSRKTGGSTIAPSVLDYVWQLVHGALTSPSLTRPLCRASRSAQGFLAVPLCSLVKDDNIEELFRLHVWLADAQRGNVDCPIHSHQPFAQSWILCGQGKDHAYNVERVDKQVSATHAEYELSWNDGKGFSSAYKTHQTHSTIVNTKRWVHAKQIHSTTHSRNMTYTIPSASFHTTEVPPDTFHATLFFFDSSRGFKKDAGVLGPKNGDSFTQTRDPTGVTPTELSSLVETLRTWEILMDKGKQHSQRAHLEQALRAFNSALSLCDSMPELVNANRCRLLVLGALGHSNRTFGRYEQAKLHLETALAEMETCSESVDFSGELGVVYRQMNRLHDAKRAFQVQYDTAKRLQLEDAMCRAVGNLGMVNYQLYQQSNDESLLQLAIEQLRERVEVSRRIKTELATAKLSPNARTVSLTHATTREVIGLSRLSLCYTERGDAEKAIKASLESLEVAKTREDSTVIAMSRFFHGRALLRAGRREEAFEQFNPRGVFTPAMAFCREPSEEHRQYLLTLVEAGADMDLTDEHGYTALDHAYFSGDAATVELVLDGLRRNLDGDVAAKLSQRQQGSKLRKGYRELFQERLRPELLSRRGLQNLRLAYAQELAADEDKREIFDGLKFLRYSDFCRFGRIPRSSDNLVQRFQPGGGDGTADALGHATDQRVVFFSYTRINRAPRAASPDDENHTLYRRMTAAAEEFLRLHPSVARDKLFIWLDHACVDQDDPQRGVTALPMIVAQCDAVISLADARYYRRAWCTVEAMMVQALRRSYGVHLWYEQVAGPEAGSWRLRDGPVDMELVMADKQLSFEEDRPKVLFLERQSKLLG